jgi:hypothetical protein
VFANDRTELNDGTIGTWNLVRPAAVAGRPAWW